MKNECLNDLACSGLSLLHSCAEIVNQYKLRLIRENGAKLFAFDSTSGSLSSMRVNLIHIGDNAIPCCPSQESKLSLTSAGELYLVDIMTGYDSDNIIEH